MAEVKHELKRDTNITPEEWTRIEVDYWAALPPFFEHRLLRLHRFEGNFVTFFKHELDWRNGRN
jgi:hypothetical protein